MSSDSSGAPPLRTRQVYIPGPLERLRDWFTERVPDDGSPAARDWRGWAWFGLGCAVLAVLGLAFVGLVVLFTPGRPAGPLAWARALGDALHWLPLRLGAGAALVLGAVRLARTQQRLLRLLAQVALVAYAVLLAARML